jgi:cyclophilin family peptidyl-prolyl cis-trans isomerase
MSTLIRFVLPEAGTYEVRALYRGFGPSNLLFFASAWTGIEIQPDGEARALHALVHTDAGDMEFAFFAEDALATSTHFLTLVSMHYYDDTLFHRVEKDFVIQGGDRSGSGTSDPGFFIPQEFNRRPHLEGSISMARRIDHVDTAGSQFFICFRMSPQNQKLLDGQYTVFARVARGFETARKIGDVRVDSDMHPVEPVRITQITLVKR